MDNESRWWLWPAVIGGIVLLVYGIGSYYFANLVVAGTTSTLAESAAAVGEPAEYGLPQPEAVQFPGDGVTLAGWFFENEADADCAVMFMHGYTGTRAQALYWAPLFWERGCDLLAYDHRGHGESSEALHTYGYFEKRDALDALQWLSARSGLPQEAIGVGGVSYGAATALQLAPLAPDLAFILADSPYSSLEDILAYQAEAQFGAVGRAFLEGAIFNAELLTGIDADLVSPETAVAEAEMPVLLIHSATDEFTPAEQSRAIFANSKQSETVLHINSWGSEHAGDIGTDFDAYKAEVDDFLARFAPDFGQ